MEEASGEEWRGGQESEELGEESGYERADKGRAGQGRIG